MTTTAAQQNIEVMAAAARKELAKRRFIPFCARMDDQYARARHIDVLAEYLEALERREITKLIVNEPPRHSKSYHVSERFPAWYFGRNPRDQVIIGTYAQEKSNDFSRKVRGLLQHPLYPFDVRVAKDSSAVNRWNTNQGGTLLAAGVGGGLTGFGAHLLIIDDSVKGRKEADSPVYRQDQWNWFTDVAGTRRMPRAAQLVTMTRWHEDDIVGRILNSKDARNWTVLDLPAIAERPEDRPDPVTKLPRPDILGRAPGEALWPAWFPREALPSVENGEISLRSWFALYQQRPTTPEGITIKRAWFVRRWTMLPTLKATVQVVDSAFEDGVANDWSVIATFGTDGVDLYLIDIWRGRVEFPDLITALKDQYAKHRPTRGVIIEKKASGHSAIQTLRRSTRIPVNPFPDPNDRQQSELAQLSKQVK